MNVSLKVVLVVVSVSLSFYKPGYAAFLDSVTDTLSKAGDAIVETAEDVVDSAKSVGEDIGVIDKEEEAPAANGSQNKKPETTQKKSAPAAAAQQSGKSAAKLPGGVTSRIDKMDKELDKVEKKLTTGVGSSSDRAKRAKLDLNRAQKYMDEIETRYKEHYSSNDPVMVAARDRLASVSQQWEDALNEATAAESAEAAAAEEKRKSEEAEKEKIAQDQEQQRRAEENARQTAQASCEEWRQKLEQFMGGDKGLMAYATEDMQLIKEWRIVYDEAGETLKDYPQGLCNSADSAAKYVQQKLSEFEQIDAAATQKMAADKADKGEIVFSASPISDPGNVVPQSEFKTGDYIYGIIRLVKPWSEIYNQKKGFNVRIDVKIDGKKIHAQFVTIKSSDYSARNWLVFNIAPKPSELKAYSDENIEYGKSTPTTIQGPNEMTYHLGALSPGRHQLEFSMYYYGKTWAAGEFSIEGNGFDHYAKLHEKIAKGVVAARTMPAAQMQNSGLEEKMTALLKEAGWDNVYRLNIVDKDWWIERVNGGNTPVKARYMAAAAMTRKADGSYCYKKCTFHQDKLITGAFGELYLSFQGDEVPINKENIDK